jgi:hypothetical protein
MTVRSEDGLVQSSILWTGSVLRPEDKVVLITTNSALGRICSKALAKILEEKK